MINSFHFKRKMKNKHFQQENIMLRGTLSNSFNSKQWDQINSCSPENFHQQQQSIFHWLMLYVDKFSKYFALFYSNHTQLHYWYLLAREQHYDIEKYVFKKLLNKTVQDYVEQFKEVQALKERQKGRNRKVLAEKSQQKQTLEQLSHKIFKLLANKQSSLSLNSKKKTLKEQQAGDENQKQHKKTSVDDFPLFSPDEKNSKNRRNNLKKEDFHDLYIKTFHACEGSRYIFYNHEKHMKGLSEVNLYNNFIRNKSRKGRSKDINILDLHKKQVKQEKENEKRFVTEYDGIHGHRQEQRAIFAYEYCTLDDLNQRPRKQQEKRKQLKSQVIFRRYRKHNIGKFIRK